ncbi:MAG: KamA family protein [Tannerella sp.]|jgi:lysine 2,3-aminomutase|nr:KamA family protein [Tannerella sp.]
MNTLFIHWTLKDLKKRFITDCPQICQAVKESVSVKQFKEKIMELFPYDTILQLIRYDGETVTDFSTGKDVYIRTVSLLYSFLRSEKNTCNDATDDAVKTDLFTDLYFIFRNTPGRVRHETVTEAKVMQWAGQWVSGLDPNVRQTRETNRQRIINKLIRRLERRHSVNSPYYLSPSRSFEEKQRLVNEWWNSHRFQLHMAVKHPDELNFFLDNTLSGETMNILHDARKKNIPFFITPYYASLLDVSGNSFDDSVLRSYILYTKELVETFGEIKAWEKEDEVEAGKANAAGWILPEGHNIHRRYPEAAIFIPDSIGRACGGLCASCQRMYDFQSRRLNFDFKELSPKESWPVKLKKLMTYFEEDTQLRDILITGGDALMSRNATLRNLFDAIYRTALQKKKANENRPDGEKYAEIQRIRLGTRLPVYLPMRVDEELISILKDFREKASKTGITQLIVQTHYQTPLEMTKESSEAIKRILSAGWIVTNQLVFNVAASRRGHAVALRRTLINNGVVPYYTFSVKGFRENYAVYAPIARSMQERAEEKAYGTLSMDEQDEFVNILRNNIPYTKEINKFLLKRKHPFIATDRSVLNLPGIGKSMTFYLAGITDEGKRILCFDHDSTRKHSPAIEDFGKIYITENKSILAYLKQLHESGEDIKAYQSIWEYTEGTTEPKFKLYEYPDLPFQITKAVNHIRIR